MKYYQRGSLEQEVRRAGGYGLPLEQALRWAAAGAAFRVAPCHFKHQPANDASNTLVPHARSLASDVLHGLAELHEAGVVVLDLKPANVLLTEQGRAVLADFGLARVLQEGATRMVGWASAGLDGRLAGWLVECPWWLAKQSTSRLVHNHPCLVAAVHDLGPGHGRVHGP
jgi:serine/threonine protein kinase